MRETVLVVDDEPDVVDLVRYNLRKAGFETLEAGTGAEALALARSHHPDLIVLDVMLPERSGFEVCKELRGDPETREIPVLMLTAKAQTEDRVTGLELGADDYLTKPFSTRELVLRAQGLVKRVRGGERAAVSLQVGDLKLDRVSFEFTVRGQKLELTNLEFKLLAALVERRGKSVPRDVLLQEVWGYHNMMETRTVDTHIRRLREKLGAHADRVETVRGEGYRYRVEETEKLGE
jgi:DNA-binding response OmpR family regulator